MKLKTPRWWYARERIPSPVVRTLLRPASWAWTYVTARRIARTQPFDSGVPVICVGGQTVGGAGKTPVARAILEMLRARGVNAAALSRGYGGKLAGPIAVDAARHSAAEVGDEPLMLARDGPAFIARDRAAGARSAVAAGVQAIVLDDGHQNPSLRKTLSLVVVDGETRGEWPFGDGAVFPAGPMREPLKVGLARADAVVVMLPADLDHPDPELMALVAGKPVLIARLEPASEASPQGPVLAFAGIAKPWRFERALVAAGCELADFAAFADHAPYTEEMLRFLADRAQHLGASLITTEKDWVRLPPAWRDRIAAWPVRARFEDEAALAALLPL